MGNEFVIDGHKDINSLLSFILHQLYEENIEFEKLKKNITEYERYKVNNNEIEMKIIEFFYNSKYNEENFRKNLGILVEKKGKLFELEYEFDPFSPESDIKNEENVLFNNFVELLEHYHKKVEFFLKKYDEKMDKKTEDKILEFNSNINKQLENQKINYLAILSSMLSIFTILGVNTSIITGFLKYSKDLKNVDLNRFVELFGITNLILILLLGYIFILIKFLFIRNEKKWCGIYLGIFHLAMIIILILFIWA